MAKVMECGLCCKQSLCYPLACNHGETSRGCNKCYVEWFLLKKTCPWCRRLQTLAYLQEIGVVKGELLRLFVILIELYLMYFLYLKEHNIQIMARYFNAIETMREENENFDVELFETRFEHHKTGGLLKDIHYVFDFVLTLRLNSDLDFYAYD